MAAKTEPPLCEALILLRLVWVRVMAISRGGQTLCKSAVYVLRAH